MSDEDIFKIIAPAATHKDEQIAKIENDLQNEKDLRKEERFYWIFGMLFMIDILTLPNATNSVGVTMIIIFEFVFLICLAACLGLENVSIILSNILSKFMDKRK